MKQYNISSIIDLIKADESNTFQLSGTVDDETVIVFSKDNFVSDTEYFYSERSFLIPETITTDAAALTYFKALFTNWKNENGAGLIRGYVALNSEYQPLDNYNGTEEVKTVYGKKDTTTYGRKDTTTYGRTEDRDSSLYGYNSSTAVPADKQHIELSNDDVIELSGSDNTQLSGTDTITRTRSGNLGLTTTQQMIESEIALRLKAWIRNIIGSFYSQYTIY